MPTDSRFLHERVGTRQKKRLMTLAYLSLLHRYKAGLVHYLSPTEDYQHQAQKMKRLGIFSRVPHTFAVFECVGSHV